MPYAPQWGQQERERDYIQIRMMRRLMNDKLENIWKEAAVA
jgi:hypothetical protein